MFQGGMRFGRSSSSSDSKGKGAGIAILIAVALIVLAWILSIVIRFALSRKREYLADAGSIELTKNPDAMITALRKIEGRGELAHANSAVMEMCIDNPRVGFSNVFDTHPSIDKRVAAIVDFAGGHDPGPLALPEPEQPPSETVPASETAEHGPWGDANEPQSGGDKPFLPARPPVELGGPAPGVAEPGPWGPRGQN
jgi:heat shock protein HtpX